MPKRSHVGIRFSNSPDARLAERRCRICEWAGAVIERPGQPADCPWCHGPTDLVSLIAASTESVSGAKNPHAAALGRLGGLKGGQARAAALTAKQRREIAVKAARARWRKSRVK
jgi:hypothetical protein